MRKTLSIFLTFLILLSTTGVSVSRHYCGDFLMDTSILSDAHGCGDMGDMPMDCCHDEMDHFELQDDFQTTVISIDLNPNFELVSFEFPKYAQINLTSEKLIHSFIEPPSPPLIKGDIFVKVQSFLI